MGFDKIKLGGNARIQPTRKGNRCAACSEVVTDKDPAKFARVIVTGRGLSGQTVTYIQPGRIHATHPEEPDGTVRATTN